MARQTSVEAYHGILRDGTLNQRQLQVLRRLVWAGPGTARELAQGYERIEGLWKRLSELRDKGYAEEVGQRQCSITGRTAIVWGFAGPKEAPQARLF